MKIFIVGVRGRMGQEIVKVIRKNRKTHFAGGLARERQGLIVENLSQVKTLPDIVIDFSGPELFRETLDWCLKNKIAFLSGTTGLTPADFNKIKNAGKKIPVLWTANTSIGVQIMKDLLKALPLPASYKVQMTEWHHIHKKDKPSGTAIVLQKILDKKRKGLAKPRSVREGEIVGTHRVVLSSMEEEIVIEHKALKRAVFAKGAVEVAQWLKKQKPGCYQMEDYVKSY